MNYLVLLKMDLLHSKFQKISIDYSDNVKKVVNVIPFKDSVMAAAGEEYNKASGVKRFFFGNNYRAEWAAKVDLKVFNISREKGGFKIKSLGGGKQTKSLRLEDKDGKEWVLRTINKDPAKAIPDLLNAVHVTGAAPTYYFVPDDPAFGIYQQKFANTVCELEEREPTPDRSETKSTPKMINKL